jgi:hypothetical protein
MVTGVIPVSAWGKVIALPATVYPAGGKTTVPW